MKCLICKKPLSNPESIALRVGPDCRAKFAALATAAGSSIERVEALTLSGNAEVARWADLAQKAIAAGRKRDAQDFLAAAEKAAEKAGSDAEPPAPQPRKEAPAQPIAREIRIEKNGEAVIFCPPWKDSEFLSDFKKRVHRSFRRWNYDAYRWELTPTDDQMVPFVAEILRRHFQGYKISIV